MQTLKINTTVNVPDGDICNFLDTNYNVSKQKCRFCITNGGSKHCALFNSTPLLSNGIEVLKCPQCCGKLQPQPDVTQEGPRIDLKQLVNDLLSEFMKVRKQLNNQGFPDNLAVPQAAKFIKSKYKQELSMYTLDLYDKKTKRSFTVKFTSPYLLNQWKKRHKIPYSKRLVIISESYERSWD